jgi:hypothetical protein
MEKNYEEFLRGAEYRKTWSIAFFSSTNAAVEIVKAMGILTPNAPAKETQELIILWRNWLLEQHGKYYAENIAIVGMEGIAPNVKEGLDKVKATYENSK